MLRTGLSNHEPLHARPASGFTQSRDPATSRMPFDMLPSTRPGRKKGRPAIPRQGGYQAPPRGRPIVSKRLPNHRLDFCLSARYTFRLDEMSGSRHKAREVALQILYELDSSGHSFEEVMSRVTAERTVPAEAIPFVTRLVKDVLERKAELDSIIQKYAPAFPVAQLSYVDRNVLRLAISELLTGQVPYKAVIDEAVELAKTFGSDASPRFVNGVLGSVIGELTGKGKNTTVAKRRH